jgi:hypothetical protein
VIEANGRLCAVEIKLSAAPGPDDMRRLNKVADLSGAARRGLVSQTRQVVTSDREESLNLPWLIRHLQTGLGLW